MGEPNLVEIKRWCEQLRTDDQLSLLEHLVRHLHPGSKKVRSLRGIWKDSFPENLDLDAALKEIRSQWLHQEAH